MRRALIVLFSLILTGAAVQAQEPNTTAGAKAILFQFNGLSVLGAGAFQGGIGMKYYLSDYSALRGSLSLAFASETDPANPGPGQTGTDGSKSASTVGVTAAIEVHLTRTRISPYWGGGLLFNVTSTDSKNPVIAPVVQTETKNRLTGETVNQFGFQAGTNFGIFALAGVEVYVTKEVSLAAEYNLGFISSSRKDEEDTQGNVTTTSKGGSGSVFGITNNGLLTLAVYF